MYHSITIGDKNTLDDFYLLSPGILVVAPAQPKFDYVEVLGKDGSLDYTEALTKIPKYSDREGSWEFVILNPGDIPDTRPLEDEMPYATANLRDSINEYFDGRFFDKIVLDDDPEYYYSGRVWVSEHQPNAGWSRVILNYRLEPFKKKELPHTTIVLGGPNTEEREISKTVIIKPGKGAQYSPLHVKVTAPIKTVSLTVNFYNPETMSSYFSKILNGVYPNGTILHSMGITNIYGDNECETDFELAYTTASITTTIEYWWDESRR